jgi:hypothetical protein
MSVVPSRAHRKAAPAAAKRPSLQSMRHIPRKSAISQNISARERMAHRFSPL